MFDVLEIKFLDSEKPEPNKQVMNNLIVTITDDFSFLHAEAEAEAEEGRPLILQVTPKKMSQKQLDELQDWEP